MKVLSKANNMNYNKFRAQINVTRKVEKNYTLKKELCLKNKKNKITQSQINCSQI